MVSSSLGSAVRARTVLPGCFSRLSCPGCAKFKLTSARFPDILRKPRSPIGIQPVGEFVAAA
jgi:hypothetical protein